MSNCTLCKKPIGDIPKNVWVEFYVNGEHRSVVSAAGCCDRCARAVCSIGMACMNRIKDDLTVTPKYSDRIVAPKPPSLLGRLHDTICGALLWVIDRG